MAIRSHKMPKAYLKRFAAAPEKRKKYGKLCVYERGNEPRIGTPNSESAERGFFVSRSEDGTLDDFQAETWTQRIEDNALDAIIYALSPVFVWTRENRRQTAEYWALMFLRSTSFYDFHKNGSEDVFGAQMRRLNTDPEFRQKLISHYSYVLGRPFKEDEILGSIGRAVASLLSPAELRSQYVHHLKRRVEIFSDILLAKPWQIWEASTDAEFVTCDSPVMTFRLDTWGRYFVGDGFAKEGSIIILPLSPKACLTAGVQGPQSRHIARSDVHEVNKIIISSSARFVYAKSNDIDIDRLVQQFAGSIRYGINAFTRHEADDFADLFI